MPERRAGLGIDCGKGTRRLAVEHYAPRSREHTTIICAGHLLIDLPHGSASLNIQGPQIPAGRIAIRVTKHAASDAATSACTTACRASSSTAASSGCRGCRTELRAAINPAVFDGHQVIET